MLTSRKLVGKQNPPPILRVWSLGIPASWSQLASKVTCEAAMPARRGTGQNSQAVCGLHYACTSLWDSVQQPLSCWKQASKRVWLKLVPAGKGCRNKVVTSLKDKAEETTSKGTSKYLVKPICDKPNQHLSTPVRPMIPPFACN